MERNTPGNFGSGSAMKSKGLAMESKGSVRETKSSVQKRRKVWQFREQILAGNLPQPEINYKIRGKYFPDTQ